MNKYLPKIILIILYCNLSFAEQLLNQDVDISSGSTLSNDSGLTVENLVAALILLITGVQLKQQILHLVFKISD